MKKLISISCTLVLLLLICVPALGAATNFNSQIISELEKGFTIGDNTYQLPSSTVNEVEKYLNGKGHSITNKQAADEVIGYNETAINTIRDFVIKNNYDYDLKDFTTAQKAQIGGILIDAAWSAYGEDAPVIWLNEDQTIVLVQDKSASVPTKLEIPKLVRSSDVGGGSYNGGIGGSGEGNPSDTYESDTTRDFSVKGTYTLKIISKNGKVPTLAAGTPDVFDVQLVDHHGNDYYFKLTAIGAPGAQAGIYVNGGSRLLVAAVGSTAKTYVSDTTKDFSLKGAYTFKITSRNGKAPEFAVGTPGVFDVQRVKVSGNSYYFKLTAVGAPGMKAGVYVNHGPRLLIATIGSNPNYVTLDTGKQLTVKSGKTYQFKATASKKPSFVSGNSSAFRVTFAGTKGSDYFFKVTAVGKAGSSAGFYINGEKAPRTIGTVA